MDYAVAITLVIWSIILMRSFLFLRKEKIEMDKKERALSNNIQKLKLDTKQSVMLLEQKEKESILAFEKIQIEKRNEFNRLLAEAKKLKETFEKSFLTGREWLAQAYSDYIKASDNKLECSLIIKPNPAWKAAETVAKLKKSRSDMAKKMKFLEFQLKSYEEYFPQLIEYRTAILDELVDFRHESIEEDENIDPALKYGFLSKEEYQALPNNEKFQLALDRYWKRNKSNLEIGRLYERYIGYLYESKGWHVRYEGIIKGYADFGRDLICSKAGKVLIIQCKCWSKEKVIREKYVMQLLGTPILFEYEQSIIDVEARFYATTELSKEAQLVANRLGVKIHYKNLKKYPMIKCNVNHRTKEKIYHLPFDQQYDKVIIGDQPNEFFADTVSQAEEKGFRRAFRWSGKK